MATEFSIRQLLACMDVSVFDPVTERALKKVAGMETALEKEPQTDVVSSITMFLAAFICFWGLRPYPYMTGIPLFFCCAAALHGKNSPVTVFWLKTYLLCGSFLLTEALFKVSPAGMTFFLSLLLFYSLFRVSGGWRRTVVSGLLFCCAYFCFPDHPAVSLILLPVLGTLELLFPLKRIYAREPAEVFTILPLFFLLGEEIRQGMSCPLVFPLLFTLQLILLGIGLYRDLETGEKIRFFFETVCLSVCGFFLSAGLEGSVVLFFLAYFTNMPAFAFIATVLFVLFLILSLMASSLSLMSAGVAALIAGVIFALVWRRTGWLLKRKQVK